MSKKNRHFQQGNPNQNNPIVAVAEPETVTPEVKADETAEPKADILSSLIEQLPDELKALVNSYQAIKNPELKKKAEANLQKICATEQETIDAGKWGNFNKDAEQELRKVLSELQTKHNVSMLGRKVVLAYGEANNPTYTHTIIGKTTSQSGNGRKGGFTSHGKVICEGEEHNSLHALCVSKNWKYEGRRTAYEAVEKPQDMTGKDLGFKNTITKDESGKLIVTKEG